MDDCKQFNDLYAFVQVAKLGSFTQAAVILNVQPSALSHRINHLEKRLKIKLLNRTTRSVATTEAGQQLLKCIAPMFTAIQQELGALSNFRDKMNGKIRINTPERPAFEIIYPKIKEFLVDKPDVKLDIFINNLYCDIVAERFDFGVRSGENVAQDMVAVKISDENTMAVVASPNYIDNYGQPRNLKELTMHRCIVVSFNEEYRLSKWEFIEKKQINKIDVPEKIIFNSMKLAKQAAIDGLGIVWSPRSSVKEELQSGQLVEFFSELSITYPPMYLYYPKNKYKTPAMTALIELLKWKA